MQDELAPKVRHRLEQMAASSIVGGDIRAALAEIERLAAQVETLRALHAEGLSALSDDDRRLLKMLHGNWNNEKDGYWPAIDAMEEAAGVIERLAAQLAAILEATNETERDDAIIAARKQ